MKAIFDAYYFAYKNVWERFDFNTGSGLLLDTLLKTVNPAQAKYTIPIADGRVFQGNLNNSRYRTLFLYRTHEPNETEIFRACIKPGDTVLDVGANIGWYTTLAANLVGNGQVHSFEPVSLVADDLTENVKRNNFRNVQIHRLALSDQPTTATIYFNQKQWGLSSLRQGVNTSSVELTVTLDTLDNWTQNNQIQNINFIKCDIEGAECLFLKGAHGTLTTLQPTIMIEVCDRHLRQFGDSSQKLLGTLSDMGYKLYQIDRDKEKRTFLQLIDENTPIQELNVLAIPRNTSQKTYLHDKLRAFIN